MGSTLAFRSARSLVVAISLTWPLHTVAPTFGQRPSAVVLDRVLLRRLDSLAADSQIQRLVPGATGMQLLTRAPLNHVRRLDDTTLVRFTKTIGRALEKAETRTCARIVRTIGTPQFGRAFAALLTGADSALAEEWTDIVVVLLWADLHGIPAGHRASPDEFDKITRAAHELIPAAEREEIVRLRAAPVRSDAEDCFLAQGLFRSMHRLPVVTVAPALRAIIVP